MANRTAVTVLLAAMLTAAVAAQPPAPAIAPPAIRSPEVGADARVTFRIAAPNAKTVSVGIEGSPPRPMQRDEKGVWTVTTEPLEPDYYGYSFRDWLTTRQIRFTAVDTPGGHTWMVWRRNLAAFAPLLFKSAVDAPTAASQDSMITQSERTELVDLLLKSEREFMQELEGLTDRQWSFKPGPDRWSVGEVVEHIVLADAMLFDTATKSLTAPPDDKWDATLSKTETLRRALPNRSRRVDAPVGIQPQRAMTREQLLSRFMEQRARALKYARETDAPLKAHTAANPFFGSLNAHQWLLYIPLHHLRHNQQIVEVKASPGYPK